MNSIRIVPNLPTARRRATRLAQATPLVAAMLVALISCTDGSVTEPFVPASPVAGLKASYDSAASMEEKLAPLAAESRLGALTPLNSSSASSAAAGMNVSSIAFAPEAGPFEHQLPACDD